jgi:hypothetical protein
MKSMVVLVFLMFAVEMKSQCDSLIQVMTSGSGYSIGTMNQQGNPITISADVFCAQFVFGYEADSSYTRWAFSEFLLNRKKLFLSNWCMNRAINYDAENDQAVADWTEEEMRERSTTRIFPVQGNDTIQFYRTLNWVDRLTSSLSFNRYVNSNGLAFSVELINTIDRSRIVLLDTFRIEPTTSSKKPCIYSWYPMASRVRTVVPISQDSTDAFIRINVWTSGTSPEPFVRGDVYGGMMSSSDLASIGWRNYRDSVEANIECNNSTSCDLTVSALSGPSRLSIGYVSSASLTQVMACNIYGDVVWSSFLPMGLNPTNVSTVSGLYIVLGLINGQVVCTKKIFLP